MRPRPQPVPAPTLLGCLVLAALLVTGCATTHSPSTPPGRLVLSSGKASGRAALPPAPVLRARAPEMNPRALALAIHEAVNELRLDHGLPPLAWAAAYALPAEAHSRDMAARGYFSHVSPEGNDATSRAALAGLETTFEQGAYRIDGLGENLLLTHRFDTYRIHTSPRGEVRYDVHWMAASDLARQTVEAWYESPSHRANLLNPMYARAAIGVAPGTGHALFITQSLLP